MVFFLILFFYTETHVTGFKLHSGSSSCFNFSNHELRKTVLQDFN